MFAYEQTAFGSLVLPALAKIRGGDARDLCVVCLGAEHAQSALEGAGCVHSVNIPKKKIEKKGTLHITLDVSREESIMQCRIE